jgi:hypothetical protein
MKENIKDQNFGEKDEKYHLTNIGKKTKSKNMKTDHFKKSRLLH